MSMNESSRVNHCHIWMKTFKNKKSNYCLNNIWFHAPRRLLCEAFKWRQNIVTGNMNVVLFTRQSILLSSWRSKKSHVTHHSNHFFFLHQSLPLMKQMQNIKQHHTYIWQSSFFGLAKSSFFVFCSSSFPLERAFFELLHTSKISTGSVFDMTKK